MKYKKSLIFICLIIFLFTIASVCASDENQTAVAIYENSQELDLSNEDSLAVSVDADDSISSEVKDTLNDDIYASNYEESYLKEVNKTDSTLDDVGDFNLNYSQTARFNVNFEGATGITAKIGDLNLNVTEKNTILIPKLNAGTYTLTVTTIPDDTHNAVTKTATITVNKINPTITFKDSDLIKDYGKSFHIGVKVSSANVDGESVSIDETGIIIPILNAGTHTLTFTTLPDVNHNAVTKTVTITVNKVNSAIAIKDLYVDYGSKSNMTVTTVGVKNFTAKIGSLQLDVVDNTIIIPTLDVGTHILNVTTIPDANHIAVTNTSVITVNTVDYFIGVHDMTLNYGSSFNITLNSNDGVKFTAKIDDGNNVDVINNVISFPKLAVGVHTLIVFTVKDANHNSVNKTVKITVNKAKIDVITFDSKAEVNQKTTLTAIIGCFETVNDGVVVFYEGKNKIGEIKVNNGIAAVTYTPSKAGNYSIFAEYKGTSIYEYSNSTSTLSVLEKFNLEDNSVSVVSSSDGEVTIHVKLAGEATGDIRLTLNGKNYKPTLENGNYTFKISDLDDGVYTYFIYYSGDSVYDPFNDTGSFKVNKTVPQINNNSKINITFDSITGISSGSIVTINLPDDATGNVTLEINGKSENFSVTNGIATVKVPNVDYGTYPYSITYSGDSKYNSFTKNGTLVKTAPKVDPRISARSLSFVYSSGLYYTIGVYGTDGNLANDVTVKISGKISQTLKTTNGIAKFKVTQAPGTYKITITALSKSVSKTITVKHLVTLKTATVKKSAKKLVLTATLGKVNGKYLNKKTVTFKFNGKKYKATTNSKGVAKVTIKSSVLKKLKVGKKVTYQATYSKDTVKKTATIKK